MEIQKPAAAGSFGADPAAAGWKIQTYALRVSW
jgi:hypothetical protein